MSFKIVLTVAVAFLCGVKAQESDVNCDFPNNHPENCDTSTFLSHLTCRESGEDCTCINEDLTECEVTDVEYETLTAEQCKTLCETEGTCRFYKHITVMIWNLIELLIFPQLSKILYIKFAFTRFHYFRFNLRGIAT